MFRIGIVEDDGVTSAYVGGASLETQAAYVRTGGLYTVTISTDGVAYADMPAQRAHSVLIRGVAAGAAVSNVTVQGQPVPQTGPDAPAPGWWINEVPSLTAPLGAVVVAAGAFPTAWLGYVVVTVQVYPPP